MDPAQYEAQLWDLMFRTMRFMLVTYVPLQVAAIVIMKRLTWRIVAALPLIPMLPVIYAGMNRDAYRDGSLYGLVFYFPYAPVMVYLAFFCFAGLTSRSAKANKLDSGETTSSEGNRLSLLLLSLAVIFGIGLMLLVLMFLPR